MDVLAQSSLLVAAISFALGVSLVARNIRNKLYLGFCGLCCVISFWALMFFLKVYRDNDLFYRFHLLGNIWLGPVGLLFVRELTRFRGRFNQILLNLSWIGSLGLTAALVLGWDNRIPWVRQLIYFAPAFIAIHVIQVMSFDLRSELVMPGLSYGKRLCIYIGAFLVLSTSIMDHVPWLPRFIPAIGNVTLILYLSFISLSISDRKLLNMSVLFSRFAILLIVALTLTAVYSLLFAWIEDRPALFLLNSFMVSFLVLMLLDPLRGLVRFLAQRVMPQDHRKIEEAVHRARRDLAGVVDLQGFFTIILDFFEHRLEARSVALYVMNPGSVRYVREVARNQTGVSEILIGHPLIHYALSIQRRGGTPALIDRVLETEADRSATRTQRERFEGYQLALKALGGNMLVPLVDSGEMLGFAIVQFDRGDEVGRASESKLQLASSLFEDSARTLRSLKLMTLQKERERLAALGEMAAGLAHEIRNPLGAIRGAAQVLDPARDGADSRFLNVIIEEVDRLNRVVTQFLDYSKSQISHNELLDLQTLCVRTVELLERTLPPGIELQTRYSSQPSRVRASGVQIHQVILNLVQNSIQAFERAGSGGVITLGIRTGLDEVELTVRDTGPGIKKENLDKVFIPFFTTSPKGTGLGLSISQKIVSENGGRIHVQSEEGAYTQFTVVFPLVDATTQKLLNTQSNLEGGL